MGKIRILRTRTPVRISTTTFLTLCQNRLLPRFDQSFAALIEDLDQRGLLDQTLVVCMGEFHSARGSGTEICGCFAGAKALGRAVYSIALAGAGVQRGAVVGHLGSARSGAGDRSVWAVGRGGDHVSRVGIDPRGHYADTVGRPYAIATGRPIEAIY